MPRPESPSARLVALIGGPTGIGTHTSRLPGMLADRRPATPANPTTSTAAASPATIAPASITPPATTMAPAAPATAATTATTATVDDAPADDRGVPRLYCPPALRDDRALGEEVNDLLIEWAQQVGIYTDRIDEVEALNLGRMIMLTFAFTDDPDRLLAAAKCTLAQWATDDYYCDDESFGAAPAMNGSRLLVALAAVDPANLPSRYAPDLERTLREDPVLVSLRSSSAHLAEYASWTQEARYRHELTRLFVGYNAEAAWRVSQRVPPVWEYLVCRQANSFMPCIVMVDAVDGYEVPVAAYMEPRVRRIITMAASSSVIVNDLYSMAREEEKPGMNFNLPDIITAEENCSRQEAVERTVEVHDELVRTFEREAKALSLAGPPELARFLASVWAWLGGNREWHSTTVRYNGAGSGRDRPRG